MYPSSDVSLSGRLDISQGFCPVHQIWPRLCDGAVTHGRLFPPLTPYRFNQELRQGMLGAGNSDGGEYSPRCYRRGATQELHLAEQPTDVIKSAGCWAGMGFRPCIDTQMTDALKVSRLLTRICDSGSEEDRGGPANMAASDTAQGKLRVSPTRPEESSPS